MVMYDLESIVFSRVKSDVTKALKDEFKDLFFTTSGKNYNPSKFPCVYLRMLSSNENGKTLSNDNINAVYLNFQIEVADNQSQRRATRVQNEVVKSFKKMRFSINSMPYSASGSQFVNTQDNSDYYRCIARARRMVAESDIL